jgi:hypothetical protein
LLICLVVPCPDPLVSRPLRSIILLCAPVCFGVRRQYGEVSSCSYPCVRLLFTTIVCSLVRRLCRQWLVDLPPVCNSQALCVRTPGLPTTEGFVLCVVFVCSARCV